MRNPIAGCFSSCFGNKVTRPEAGSQIGTGGAARVSDAVEVASVRHDTPQLNVSDSSLLERGESECSVAFAEQLQTEVRSSYKKNDNWNKVDGWKQSFSPNPQLSPSSTQSDSSKEVIYGSQDLFKFLSNKIVDAQKQALNKTGKIKDTIISGIAYRHSIADKMGSSNIAGYGKIRQPGKGNLVTPLAKVSFTDNDGKTIISSDAKYSKYLPKIDATLTQTDSRGSRYKLHQYERRHGEGSIPLSTVSNDGKTTTLISTSLSGGFVDKQTSPESFPAIMEEIEGEYDFFEEALKNGDRKSDRGSVEAVVRIGHLITQGAFAERGSTTNAEWIMAALLETIEPALSTEEALGLVKDMYARGLSHNTADEFVQELKEEILSALNRMR